MYKPFKYLIQPVVLEEVDGKVVAEKPAELMAAYSPEQAIELIEQFLEQLETLNKEGADNGKVTTLDGIPLG